MNIEHLRKQAKNLRTIYPDLVAENPDALSLSKAQEIIAKTHGFPSWHAVVGSCSTKTSRFNEAATPVETGESLVARALKAGYSFELSEKSKLPVELSEEDATPTRFAIGQEATLRFRTMLDEKRVERETDKLDQLSEALGGMTGSFEEYTPAGLRRYAEAARAAVARCPLYVDGWNVLAGALFTQREYKKAIEVAEPVATSLLGMLPSKGFVQVCYGTLDNRPFYRIVHCYLLLLHALDRHAEADLLAKRMYALWPNDNMGFRFLLTKESRVDVQR